ncbi:MAG: hypothetical protein PHI14_01485 [Bacteroidales bacterium]|nr:hypothetical protein [Bacteroidales bacterium]
MYGGVGISVLLQHEILNAITEYKFSVARKDWSLDKRIFEFTNAVTLTKSNGDKAMFSGYNYQMSNGSFPFAFYKDVKLKINGKYMQAVTDNYNALNEYAFFNWGETTGMDGKRNASYYLSEFFKPTKEEQAILEEEEKHKKEALIEEERERKPKLLKNECLENLIKLLNSGQQMSIELLEKNNYKIYKDNIICNVGNISVPFGKLQREHIRYIGGTDNLLNLLSLCDYWGNIIIKTVDNEITIDTISQMFEYSSKEVIIFDENKSYFFLDTEFKLKTEFSPEQRDVSEVLKLKVKKKKGELIYTMSTESGYSKIDKSYKNDNLLNCIKKYITSTGVYKYQLIKEKGTISVRMHEDSNDISEKIPCLRIILTPLSNNTNAEIICFDKL